MRHIDFLRTSAGPLPERGGLSGWNGMAIELEYAEMLYDLVRALRPGVVLETGTGEGIASTFIAQALADNGTSPGYLWTFEPEPSYAVRARRNLNGLPVMVLDRDWAEENTISARRDGGVRPEMIFLDSGPHSRGVRQAEVDYWIECGDPSITLVVHDANRDYGLERGDGVLLPRGDGLWIGRARA